MLHVTGICRRITVYNLSTRTVILSEQPTVTEAQPNHILKGNKTNVKQICVCVEAQTDRSLKSRPAHRLQSQAKGNLAGDVGL